MSLPQVVHLFDYFNNLLVARFFWTEVHFLAIWSSSVGLKDLFWRDIDEMRS